MYTTIRSTPLPISPTFPWHMENLRTYITATSDFPQTATWRGAELKPYGAGAGMRGIPGDCYSPSRFVKAAYLNANYPQKESETENVVRMFRSLEGVVMIEGASRMGDGKFEKTIYTGCFSARTGNYYYAMYGDPSIRYVSLMDAEGASPDRLVVPRARAVRSSLVRCDIKRPRTSYEMRGRCR